MSHVFMTAVTISGYLAGAIVWSPPESPAPQTILQEAQEDAKAKDYEAALAKHVWIFEESLSIDRAFYGVRLSFALSAWHGLAKEYPPAMAKLKEKRNQAKASVMAGGRVFDSFHDMTAINRVLGQSSETYDVFVLLDNNKSKGAATERSIVKRVFPIAKPAILAAEDYELFVKYVSAEQDFQDACRIYDLTNRMANDNRFDDQYRQMQNERFETEVATLVAVLTITGRQEEAKGIVEKAREKRQDDNFNRKLDDALEGKLPKGGP